MKKLIIYICTAMLICGLFAGCGVQAASDGYMKQERFKTVYNKGNERILVDTETNVMYLYRYAGYGAGMTVMLDETGSPLLWEDKK